MCSGCSVALIGTFWHFVARYGFWQVQVVYGVCSFPTVGGVVLALVHAGVIMGFKCMLGLEVVSDSSVGGGNMTGDVVTQYC